jgi:hypothetical protein
MTTSLKIKTEGNKIKHPLACVQSELHHPHHHCYRGDGLEGTPEDPNESAAPAC